jgi:hypothetical protein
MTVDERDDPASALGDIWEALDALPRSTLSSAATATTIEMVAISAHNRSALAARPTPQAWVAALVAVVSGFLIGTAAGRATLTAPGGRVPPSQWPFVAYLDLLQEAGSVEFLHEVDRRGYPLPRLFPMLQQPIRGDTTFDEAIQGLRASALAVGKTPETTRRSGSESLSTDQQLEIEQRLKDLAKLDGVERRQLGDLARALANPENEHLVEAARLWHAWVASRDPAERRAIVSLSSDERLEWLDRYSQLQSRLPQRPLNDREWSPRRGSPPRGEIPPPPR